MTITGRWGRPAQVLLDIAVDDQGTVTGVANPGRQNAPIRHGRFDAASNRVELSGEHTATDGSITPFHIEGHLDGRTLRLTYAFGHQRGEVAVVRVEEYVPPSITILDRLRPYVAAVRRWWNARSRPDGRANLRRLRARGESLASITMREAVVGDIPALAELHVVTWNATYRVRRGPSVSLRARQWSEVFARADPREFVIVLEDHTRRLVGFSAGRPTDGDFDGELSKIYLRWEYHGLGLGRRLMNETARQFLARGMRSFILFTDLANPTLGFYDHLGGERLRDDRGQFLGAYAWRDAAVLLTER